MTDSTHYDTLDISPAATPVQIKQAYRRLVKLFHPDGNRETANHEQIVRINAAYEILGDPQQRQSYDQMLLKDRLRHEQSVNNHPSRRAESSATYTSARSQRYQQADTSARSQRQQQADTENRYYAHRQQQANAENRYYAHRQTAIDADEQLEQWLQKVYVPVNRLICRILNPLADQLDQLSADPFDDELMEQFQAYLKECRNYLKQAQLAFRSLPNPANVAGAAVHLYYCLNQVADGIEELELFTLNYDEGYLHTGQELFRIATGLRCEAQYAVKDIA
ncbi:J domain-containing protein [Coleofasciculus sp. FACHB-129]|uniref:J domain-containing protein n=1 Tax=Cyanophyceae TaxID=3028117 RepID=UPI001685A7A4|nr:J domain-containing protein [Coleofasciculus sp. FACHB-129]MBD1898303.1 DnaJ domain-containing protein [Coleofasciculus sp. FACHB-129]